MAFYLIYSSQNVSPMLIKTNKIIKNVKLNKLENYNMSCYIHLTCYKGRLIEVYDL